MPTLEEKYYEDQLETDRLLKEAKRKGYSASPETHSRIDKFLNILGWTEKQTAQRFVDPILSVALSKKLDVDLPTRTVEPGEVSAPELPHLALKDPAIRGYLDVMKKYGVLEEHPVLQHVAGFGASVAGDPLTYAPLGLIGKIPKVAKGIAKITPKIERTYPIKFFVPAAGAPPEYKLMRQLSYHAGQQAKEDAVQTARDITGKVSKSEIAAMYHIYEATAPQVGKTKELLEIPITKEEIENLARTGRVSKERIEAWLNMVEPAFEMKWLKQARPYLKQVERESHEVAKDAMERGILEEEIPRHVSHLYEGFIGKYIWGGFRKRRVISTMAKAKDIGFESGVEDIAVSHAVKMSAQRSLILKHDFIKETLEKFGMPVHTEDIKNIGLPADTPIIMWKGTIRAKPAPTEEVAKARRILMEMFGKDKDVVDVRDIGPEAIAGVKELLGKDAVAYIIPNRGIYEDLIKSSRMFQPDEAINWLGQGYDRILGTWKGLATFSVGFHVRNMIGNLYNSWLGGLHSYDVPSRFYEAVKILRGAEGKVGDVPYSEIRRMGKDFGFARYGGFFWNEILDNIEKAVYEPKLAKANPLKYSRELGNMAESLSKVMLFIDRLHKGDTHHQAFLHTVKYMFDYSPVTLTDAERKIARRVIPFYTWLRKNIPLQIESVAKAPWKIKAALRLPEITPVPEREKEVLPDYFQTSFAVRLPVETEDGKPIYALPDLPPSDLLEAGVAQDMLQRVSPAISLFGLTNEHIFRGLSRGRDPESMVWTPWAIALPGPAKDLLDVDVVRKGDKVRYVMPAKYSYLVNELVPVLPRLSRMAEGDWWAVARFFYGVVPLDVERLERTKQWEERRQKAKEKRRERELRYKIRR